MGTKTQTEGYIETILHENEHGADNGSSGYSTTEPPADDPTPITTPEEEAARADEFPAVIQAGMWVMTTQEIEAGGDTIFAGVVGQVFLDAMDACSVVVNDGEDDEYSFPLGIIPGDPLPDFLEQVNAPEPAFDEMMKHTEAPVHPAPYSSLPDSTPLDDLDGENAEPSESETVYTTATMTEPSAEYIEKNSGPIYFHFKPDQILRIPTGARVLEFRILKVSNLGLDILAAEQVYREPAPIDEPVNPGNPYEVIDYLAKLAKRADEINVEHEDVSELKKLIKKRLDKASDQLRIATLAQAEPELFHQRELASEGLPADEVDHDADTFTAAESQVPPTTSTKATPDESWRLISIDVLSLPGKIPEQLKAHSPLLGTIGAIADFTSKPFNKLTDVKGIGPGKATTIEDALMKFWRDHPEYCGPDSGVLLASNKENQAPAPDPTSTEQGAVAFDSGLTLDDNPHPRGSGDWDEWRAGFKDRAGMRDEDKAVGDEDL